MKGDFTRDTFDRAKHFSRVLSQQGRVTLDADFNEQSAIDLYYLRTLARDVIGPYAGPVNPFRVLDPTLPDAEAGFLVQSTTNPPKDAFNISAGRYYVDGILVENNQDCTYTTQPDYTPPGTDLLLQAIQNNDTSKQFGIYLDVWERHITAIEDHSILEKALDGRDTCTRAKVVWQVKAWPLTTDQQANMLNAEQKAIDAEKQAVAAKAQFEKDFQAAAAASPPDPSVLLNIFSKLQPADDELAQLWRFSRLTVHEAVLNGLPPRISNASLAARVNPVQQTGDPCVTPPDSKYRGAENQLYRVEIHQGTPTVLEHEAGIVATFKWSRDNGSVATVWLSVQGNDLQVANTRGFAAGNWVELSDDTSEKRGQPGTLVRVVKVEGDVLSIDPATTLPPFTNFPQNPKIRQWDYIATDAISRAKDNAIPIQESPVRIDLEDGVQIQFSAGGNYRTGDYWLIPARVATGNIEWPLTGNSNPQPLPPHGIEHHYALLGFVTWSGQNMNIQSDLFEFWPLFSSVNPPPLPPPPPPPPPPSPPIPISPFSPLVPLPPHPPIPPFSPLVPLSPHPPIPISPFHP